MITEFRRLVFSADEVENAVTAFNKARVTKLPGGKIARIEITEEPEVCARVWMKEGPGADQPPARVVKADYLGAALIFHCSQSRIPLPRTAKKSLERAGDGLALVFVINAAAKTASSASVHAPTPSDEQAKGKNGKRGTGQIILVVEDEPDTRSFAVAALKGLGFQTLEAADTQAATEIIDQQGDSLALLLSDVLLAGSIKGTQFAEQAKARHPELKVVFMTGHALDPEAGSTVSKIGNATVWKPLKRADLAAAIYDALDL